MKKSLFGGSALFVAALLTASLLFYTQPLVAETSSSFAKPQPTPSLANQEAALTTATVPLATDAVGTGASSTEAPRAGGNSTAAEVKAPVETSASAQPVAPPAAYVATAYSLRGRGASGLGVRKGTIAADPRVLPFGTRVRLDAGAYSGEYLVTDSGGAVKGRKIDVWVPSYSEACRFGRRNVKLTVLSYGGKRGAGARSTAAPKKKN